MKDILKGNVYYADLGVGLGSEQKGVRPVVILQNNIGNKNSPNIIIAPITSEEKKYLPTHVELPKKDFPFMDKDSTILIEQIRSISKRRLKEYRGFLDGCIMLKINKAIQISFGMFSDI